MRISCVQMDMRLGEPEENFAHAAALLRQAAAVQEKPDVLVLPETWNTGFFPAQDLANLADDDGRRVKAELGTLAGELGVNLVAGSVAIFLTARVAALPAMIRRISSRPCTRMRHLPAATACAASRSTASPAALSPAMISASRS